MPAGTARGTVPAPSFQFLALAESHDPGRKPQFMMGVDIEKSGPCPSLRTSWPRFCSDKEKARFQGAPPEMKLRWFSVYGRAREAFLKGTGDGIAAALAGWMAPNRRSHGRSHFGSSLGFYWCLGGDARDGATAMLAVDRPVVERGRIHVLTTAQFADSLAPRSAKMAKRRGVRFLEM